METCLKLTKKQLEDILRAAGKPISGTKAELCQRILNNHLSLNVLPFINLSKLTTQPTVSSTRRPVSPVKYGPPIPIVLKRTSTVRPISPPRHVPPPKQVPLSSTIALPTPIVLPRSTVSPAQMPQTEIHDLLAEIATFEPSFSLRDHLADIALIYRPQPGYIAPPRTTFATLQNFVRQNHPMVIDLVSDFTGDDLFRDRERMPLNEFLGSGFSVPINIEIRPDDILMIDEFGDNGLYYVYDHNGELMVVKTPGDYMLPHEALDMLERYNVQNRDDFANIYQVDPFLLDLTGIDNYAFADEDVGPVGEPGVYNPRVPHA